MAQETARLEGLTGALNVLAGFNEENAEACVRIGCIVSDLRNSMINLRNILSEKNSSIEKMQKLSMKLNKYSDYLDKVDDCLNENVVEIINTNNNNVFTDGTSSTVSRASTDSRTSSKQVKVIRRSEPKTTENNTSDSEDKKGICINTIISDNNAVKDELETRRPESKDRKSPTRRSKTLKDSCRPPTPCKEPRFVTLGLNSLSTAPAKVENNGTINNDHTNEKNCKIDEDSESSDDKVEPASSDDEQKDNESYNFAEIEHVNKEQLAAIQKFVKCRISECELNEFIDVINSVLKKKTDILNRQQTSKLRDSEMETFGNWKRIIKTTGLDSDTNFFTANDLIKTRDNATKNLMNKILILRQLKLIRIVYCGNEIIYVIL